MIYIVTETWNVEIFASFHRFMLLLWFLFPLIFFIYEIKKHINYFIALCSFQNDKFEKSAAPFESCRFRPLHEHLRSSTLNNLWEDFFFGEWNKFHICSSYSWKRHKDTKRKHVSPGRDTALSLFRCSDYFSCFRIQNRRKSEWNLKMILRV